MSVVQRKKRPPFIRLVDVAREACVSRSIVGHVLNGGGGNCRVSTKTAQRIREVARRLNYQPNYAARLLRGKHSHTYGLLVGSAGDPLRSFLVQDLHAEAAKIGYYTYIGNTIGKPWVGPDLFGQNVEEFARRCVDGVFCLVHNWFRGDRLALLARHPNTVFYEDPGIPDAAYVTVDRAEAARLAVRHLASRGRKRIALAVMTLSRPTHLARLQGYEKELCEQGLPVHKELVFNGETCGNAYAQCNEADHYWEFPSEITDRTIEVLIDQGRADAIVAHDDFWAASLIKRLHARGLRVPDDVAVMGYLNHYLADWTDPALTTIELQHDIAACEMVRLLNHMVTKGPLPKDKRAVLIKPKLMIRESA